MQSFTKVEAVSVLALQPHPSNPRRGDLDVVRESLEFHGQYRPIVANSRTSVIVAGHHLWLAAQELGWAEVSVAWVDLDEDEHVRMMLEDNRASDLGTYNQQGLADLLGALADSPDTFQGTGYDQAYLDRLLAVLNPEDDEDEGDEPEPAEEHQVVITCRNMAEQAQVFAKVKTLGTHVAMVSS